jgi:hypothetical protein
VSNLSNLFFSQLCCTVARTSLLRSVEDFVGIVASWSIVTKIGKLVILGTSIVVTCLLPGWALTDKSEQD